MATPRAHRIVRMLAATAAAAVLAGCASVPLDSARIDFRQGQLARAEETLVKKADEVQPKDRVLHMMERGTIRQARGHYEDSSHDFIAAADRIRELETYSASKGVASLVVNDTVQDFRGAPYERTLLHAMTELNHFAVTNWDNAAVESRRIIESLSPTQRGDFPEDAFSRYMAGFGLEMIDDFSNASLQYRKAAALAPHLAIDDQSGRIALRPPAPPPVASPAAPAAVVPPADTNSASKAVAPAPKAAPAPAPAAPPTQPAEPVRVPRPPAPKEWDNDLVCFALLGQGPSEYYGLQGRWYTHTAGYVEIWIDGRLAGRSYPLADVAELARATAAKQAALKAVKTAARVAVKEVIAETVAQSTDSEALGDLIRFLLIGMLEQPDVRRWETLPGSLQVARVPCPRKLESYELVLRGPGGAQLARVNVDAPLARRGRTYVTFYRELPSAAR